MSTTTESIPANPEEQIAHLQTKLREVTSASSALATEFMTHRETLANENAYLSTKIEQLNEVRDGHATTIANLASEQLRITRQNDDIVHRLQEVGNLIQSMGQDRMRLMDKVGEWEDGLMVAGREGWRSQTPRNTVYTPRTPREAVMSSKSTKKETKVFEFPEEEDGEDVVNGKEKTDEDVEEVKDTVKKVESKDDSGSVEEKEEETEGTEEDEEKEEEKKDEVLMSRSAESCDAVLANVASF